MAIYVIMKIVQFLWCLVSPTRIEEESTRQNLLREISYLQITTRGDSKTQNKGEL